MAINVIEAQEILIVQRFIRWLKNNYIVEDKGFWRAKDDHEKILNKYLKFRSIDGSKKAREYDRSLDKFLSGGSKPKGFDQKIEKTKQQICSGCGTINEKNSDFCLSCGISLR